MKTMEIDLEFLKETSKETSLVSSSGQWMAMQMVLMTGNDWDKLSEMGSERLMETSLVCLMAERLDVQMVLMTEIDSVQLTEKHLE